MKSIYLCAINNILSGTCQEDCKFCTQSLQYRADIERYNYKDISTIVNQARIAKANGALGYCLVTAGKSLDDKKIDFVAKACRAIKKNITGLNLIACNGTATKEQLRYLKKNEVDSYNHNLETSQNYYTKICQTHSWDERYETCENVKSAGLSLCSGGILGMGESENDRDEFLRAIAALVPDSVPLNFYHPNPALPIKNSNIDYLAAIKVIKEARFILGEDPMLMIAGGRELLFHNREDEMFRAGANSIVIGDYLTTSGATPNRDIDMIKSLGYTIAMSCSKDS